MSLHLRDNAAHSYTVRGLQKQRPDLSPPNSDGVKDHGSADEGLERPRVNLVTLTDVNGAPGVALQAGVEEAGRVIELRALGEGHLDVVPEWKAGRYSGLGRCVPNRARPFLSAFVFAGKPIAAITIKNDRASR